MVNFILKNNSNKNYQSYSELKSVLYKAQGKRQIKDNTYFGYIKSKLLKENKTITVLSNF